MRTVKNTVNLKTVRMLKALLSVFLVLAVSLSLAFVAIESHHDCEGEACPICACLAECAKTVRGFFDSLPILTAVVVLMCATVSCSFAMSKELVFSTPILSKVRMND